MEEKQLSPEEQWQQSEDERLEYEGYCRKIIQGLENQDEKSGIRAIWELVQNAKDQSRAAKIKMELTEQSFTFSHHGTPFDYPSFRALVKQDSSKDRADADLVGQYGTGFMTTHSLNRLVFVSAPFAVKSEQGIKGYVQIKNYPLDRTKVDTKEGPTIMKEQLGHVKNFWRKPQFATPIDDTTSFRYDLKPEQVAEVSCYLENAIRLMPFVLILNDSISEVAVDDQYSHKHFLFKKRGETESIHLEQNGWRKVTEVIELTDATSGTPTSIPCSSLRSDKDDIVLIPPYPAFCGELKYIPSLFLCFPLLGTEEFGVNFIFHSKRFYPVEKRNNIMLPGVSQISKEKGGDNEGILKEMMGVLFSYYDDAKHTIELGLEMLQVAFPEAWENEETERFYKEMQNLWKKEVVKWKVLPVGEERMSMDDNKVRVLHPSFYKTLNQEQKTKYEPVIAAYAKEVELNEGNAVMIPDRDLFAWSETVNRWHCDNEDGFYLNIEDVCKAIKNKGEHLFDFLKLLTDSGNGNALEDYPLLPNWKGDLRTRKSLYYGEFMTEDVYELVKVMMGDEADKMYDPEYNKIISVNPYSEADLQKDINTNLRILRSKTLERQNPELLSEEQLNALIKFCSATSNEDYNNQRGRMMPILVVFYGKTFETVKTIRYREDEEEQFYNPAFGYLLDYTLLQISQKDADWVKEHKGWLLRFLTEYAPKVNADRLKKLDSYGVLPNQKDGLCLKAGLKANAGVPDEMVEIYQALFGKDLKEGWIAPQFEGLVELEKVEPKTIAGKIEEALVEDMKKPRENRLFEKVVRQIILNMNGSSNWKNWFAYLDEKKEIYTFSMQSGDAQKSLFSLMDHIGDDDMARLAKLGESGKMTALLDKLENIEKQEYESAARFHHLHEIGKQIEKLLLNRIDREHFDLEMPKNKDEVLSVGDIQDGQDIIVKVKVGDEWKNIFYIEVKSKWDFSVDQAHMSPSQIKMASQHQDEYALCCVDLRPYKHRNLTELTEEEVVGATKVKLDIGYQLEPLMQKILEADLRSDEIQIKISDYRSNMSAKVFEKGEPFQVLLDKVEKIAKRYLETIDR